MSMPQPETEPIVGYRAWIPSEPYEGKVVLRSAVKQEFFWPHRLPVHGDVATTGVYALKNLASVLQMFGYDEGGCLFGEVYLWGRVMQHAEGYRAEFAYPKRFFVDSERGPEFIMALEDSYGVPVEIRAELDLERKKWEVYRQEKRQKCRRYSEKRLARLLAMSVEWHWRLGFTGRIHGSFAAQDVTKC